MPLGTATITYDLADMLGVDFDARRTKVWVTTNVPSETVVDTDANKIRLGSGNGSIAEDGTGSVAVWTPGTGANPASWQTYIHVAYPDRNTARGRAQRTFGPFTITASADLADLIAEQEIPPTYISQVTAQLDTYVDSAAASATSAAASADEATAIVIADVQGAMAAAVDAPGPVKDALASTIGAGVDAGIAADVPPLIATSRARLAARAGYDAARSNGFANAAAQVATRFVETWANLTAWAVTSTSVQVSAGKLYGVTGGGGANHSFRVAPGATARAVFKVDYVPGAAGGTGVLIGFNRGAEGAAPSAGGAQSRGLYFRSDGGTSGTIRGLSDGTQTSDIFTGLGASTWVVTITVDENYLSMGYSSGNGSTPRQVYRWARDDVAFPLNNLTIMINDSRGLTGSSVEPVTEATLGGTRAAFSTGNAATASQGAPALHWGSDSGDNFLVETPVGYDSRKPTPAVIMFHGNGSDELHWLSNTNGKAVAEQFLTNGYIVIAAANTGAVSTWGAQAGLDAYTRAYQVVRDHYNIGPVVLYANSMGGIESLNVLARDAIPGVAAWMGTVPTFDLAENHANALFTSTIRSAYGVAGDGSDYASKTANYDPALLDPLLFRSVPMWMLVATDDAAVTPGPNGQALYAAVADTNPRTKIEVTGGHSTGGIASNAAAMVSWCNNILGLRNSYPA